MIAESGHQEKNACSKEDWVKNVVPEILKTKEELCVLVSLIYPYFLKEHACRYIYKKL